jgi:GTP-binding protein HflX
VSHLEDQLKKSAAQRRQRRHKRTRQAIPVVSIVGYTNAGKSTLLNTLTRSDELAEDKLFATLDPRSRRLRFPEEREVVLTDTVGLIRDMPEDLFAAFRATFEEAVDADLILHVVDASDPDRDQQIETTQQVLEELGLQHVPRIVVFNKADLLTPGEGLRIVRGHRDAVALSAKSRETTRDLLKMISDLLASRWAEAAFVPSYEQQADQEQSLEEDVGGEEQAAVTLNELLAASGRRIRSSTL